MDSISRVGFIGSGRLATQLAIALYEQEIEIPIIIGRSPRKARMLAKKIGSVGGDDFNVLKNHNLDLLVIAVNDQSIAEVVEKAKVFNIPIVHTSGATAMEVLKDNESSFGVFYPLQTLTKNEIVDFRMIPVCINASDEAFKEVLLELANKICSRVYEIEDNQRALLHLCAVFLNNNINHLLTKVEDILMDQKLPREILQPLLKETIQKARYKHPAELQTGPARRNDEATKEIHSSLLDKMEDPELKTLYMSFWDSIQEYYKER